MAEKNKEKVLQEARKILELSKSGYAGVLSTGKIVDRRKYPKAIPIPESKLLGVSKPKKLK